MSSNNHNTSNTLSPIRDEKHLTIYICIHFVMPCAVAIGIIGNLLSILVFARREMIKFCVSIFTIVLAVSDILLLITSVFNIILPDFFGGSMSDRSAFWCYFHGYFDLLFAALSGYSVVFISVERWFSVWKPFKKAYYVTFKTTLITVITYTSISLLVFLWFPIILDYNPGTPKPGERCQLLRPTIYKVFGTISVIFTYIVPFFFLGVLNILIVHRLQTRRHFTIHRSVVSVNETTGNDSSLITVSSRKRQQKQRNTDRNITFMLITVAIAFMVMSFPFQIYWFYMQISQLATPNKTLFTLTQTFRYLNCCCNFFLYSATSSLFRRELSEMFQCIYQEHKVSIDDPRRKPSSTIPLLAINRESVPVERKNLLLNVNAQTLSVDRAVVNFTRRDSTNGHTNLLKV